MERALAESQQPTAGFHLPPLLLGIVVTLYVGSLATGGYVLLLNAVLVELASEPYLPLTLILLTIGVDVLLLYTLVDEAMRVAARSPLTSFALGITLTLYALGAVSTLAHPVILAAYTIVALLLGVPVAAQRLRVRRVALIASALVALALTLMLLKLYQPVASASLVAEEQLGEPIDVNGLHRFIPLMTAYVYAVDRIQLPTHTVYPEDSYIYYVDGHSIYNWIIEPEGIWNQLTREPAGIVLVYGDAYPPRVTLIERRLAWGLRNMRFTGLYFDTLLRRVVLAAGLSLKPLPEDNIEVYINDTVYILIPLVSWKRGLLESLPVPAGYAVVDEKGRIHVLSLEEVQKTFPMVPLLPEVVARQWVETLRYKPGLIQVYLYHNTFEIRDVGTNPQPYLEVDAQGRQWWVFVAEPPGRTYSARLIIYVSADEREPRVLVYQLPTPAIGVSKVASYVKQAHPTFDWEQLRVEEPIPSVINGRLYWKVTIVTRDYRGLVAVDLVDAVTNQVYSLQPRHHVSYLDLLNLLHAANKTITRQGEQGIEAKIAELEKKLQAIREEIDALIRELEELKVMLRNETRR